MKPREPDDVSRETSPPGPELDDVREVPPSTVSRPETLADVPPTSRTLHNVLRERRTIE